MYIYWEVTLQSRCSMKKIFYSKDTLTIHTPHFSVSLLRYMNSADSLQWISRRLEATFPVLYRVSINSQPIVLVVRARATPIIFPTSLQSECRSWESTVLRTTLYNLLSRKWWWTIRPVILIVMFTTIQMCHTPRPNLFNNGLPTRLECKRSARITR